MNRLLPLLAVLILSANALGQVVTQSCIDSNGKLSFTYTPAAPPIVTPPPVVIPPPPPIGTVFWVYHNGKFAWAGDYSWDAVINYKDTAGLSTGDPVSGPTDIKVTTTARWGGFQPFAFPSGGTPFDTRPYKFLRYCAKPTQVGQVFGTQFDANNDVTDGTAVNIGGQYGTTNANKVSYGPLPTVGVWGCYKIPLSDFGFNNPLVLKYTISDGTGAPPNVYYVDDMAFTAQ